MDYRKARILQYILFFGGAAAAFLGQSAEIAAAVLLGAGAMFGSIIVWLLFYRCPHCHEGLGRGTPKYCPHCGAWLGDGVEEKK